MTLEESAADITPDAEARAHELIENGISCAEAGDHDEALSDLREAEALAAEIGDDGLVIAAVINQGYAHTLHGDTDSSIRLYSRAAELARGADDSARLKIALANLSAELMSVELYEDVIANLAEYLTLVDSEDVEALTRTYVNRAAAHRGMQAHDLAIEDLDEAHRMAQEAEDPSLLYLVYMNQGFQYSQNDDPSAALIVLEKAVDIARASGDLEQRRDALMSLAHVSRIAGSSEESARLFAEAEVPCRELGDRETLAEALYWRGAALRSLKRTGRALACWDEAANIRRELGQSGHLADCLFAQAEARRSSGEHEAAGPLYAEASQIYEGMGLDDIRAELLYSWGQSLWAAGKPEDALLRADEAIQTARRIGDTVVERRSHGLKAMAAADVGDTDAAHTALDAAESICEATQAHGAMVWALARRAYVSAKEGAEPSAVVEQLKRAHEYGMGQGQAAASRSAIRKIGSYIVGSGDERYQEPLTEFRNQQLIELDAYESGMPPGMMPPTTDAPVKRADEPVEDDEVGA